MTDAILSDIPTRKPAPKKAKAKKGIERASAKEIPKGLSYVNTPLLLKKILEKMISAQTPDRLTQDYLGTVWGFTGGSAKAIIPLLKRIGFLSTDGKPTELYAKFRTDGGRSNVARQALRTGFPDVFKRNDSAEFAEDKVLTDIVVEATGREKSDPAVRAIVGTFRVISAFVSKMDRGEVITQEVPPVSAAKKLSPSPEVVDNLQKIGISYQINVVLPETTNVDVFDAIFKSIRLNLLQ